MTKITVQTLARKMSQLNAGLLIFTSEKILCYVGSQGVLPEDSKRQAPSTSSIHA